MSKPFKWTEEKLREVAKKYKTPAEFKAGDYGAYQAAVRQKIMPLITGHMVEADKGRPTTLWTQEGVLAEAKKYDTLQEFYLNSRSAYVMAHKKDMMAPIHKYFARKNKGGMG